jgi:hypothetical protein
MITGLILLILCLIDALHLALSVTLLFCSAFLMFTAVLSYCPLNGMRNTENRKKRSIKTDLRYGNYPN